MVVSSMQKPNASASAMSTASPAVPGIKFSQDIERLVLIHNIRKAPVGAQVKHVIDLLMEPKHAVKGKDELLTLIQKSLDGISVLDLKDAYPKAMEDLQALRHEGKIWLLLKFDSTDELAYTNEQRFMNVNVDDDIKKLFRSIELPVESLEMEKVLKKSRIKPATQSLGLSSTHKSEKKNRQRKRKPKLTNTYRPAKIRKFFMIL